MAVLLTNDTELKTVADAIRSKTGGSSPLGYPTGMANAITGIGADCTAQASDILGPVGATPAKTAYVGNAKVTGTMPVKSAATYSVSESAQTIQSGRYLSGTQTIRGVKISSSLSVDNGSGNIKQGVVVKIGDVGNETRLRNITGTFTSDGNIGPEHVLKDKIGYSQGARIVGNIPHESGQVIDTQKTDKVLDVAGKYLDGNITVKAVQTQNIDKPYIKHDVVVKVGDANNPERIKNVRGTFTSDGTITAEKVLSGEIGYSQGNQVVGNIPSKTADTYNASSTVQTIESGQYLSGTQTILPVTTLNISEENIRYNVNVKVGDSTYPNSITNVTGTFTSDGTLSNDAMLKDVVGYSKGTRYVGTIQPVSGNIYDLTTSDHEIIASGKYTNGSQRIRGVTTSGNIIPANIKKGVVVSVGDTGNANKFVEAVTGTCPQCVVPPGWCPIFFRRDTAWNGWYYQGDPSSSWAAERAVGYYSNRDYDTGTNKPFCVPARMTFTYYAGHHDQGNPVTKTFEANETYYLRGTSPTGSPYLAIYNSSNQLVTNFYKLVSWEYA